jgi:hypothetical protein
LRNQAAQRQPAVAKPGWTSLETRDPDAPIEPPYEDPDDPDLIPEEEEGDGDDYPLPDEDEEYAAPAVEPHEEPLVTP